MAQCFIFGAASNRIGSGRSGCTAARRMPIIAFPGPGWPSASGPTPVLTGMKVFDVCIKPRKQLAIEPELIVSALEEARLGAGDAAALANDLRTQISSQPISVSAIVTLTEALAACGEPERITVEINEWQNLATEVVPSDVITQVRALGFYHGGKIQDCADRCLSLPALAYGRLRVQSLLALGKAKDVTSDASFEQSPRRRSCHGPCGFCLELYLEHRPEEAVLWRQRARRGTWNPHAARYSPGR